jgi:hypothetical protein
VQISWDSLPNQPPSFSIPSGKAIRSLLSAEKTQGWRGEKHLQLGYDIALDNSAGINIKSIRNVTYLFTVTSRKGASWKRTPRHRSSQ